MTKQEQKKRRDTMMKVKKIKLDKMYKFKGGIIRVTSTNVAGGIFGRDLNNKPISCQVTRIIKEITQESHPEYFL